MRGDRRTSKKKISGRHVRSLDDRLDLSMEDKMDRSAIREKKRFLVIFHHPSRSSSSSSSIRGSNSALCLGGASLSHAPRFARVAPGGGVSAATSSTLLSPGAKVRTSWGYHSSSHYLVKTKALIYHQHPPIIYHLGLFNNDQNYNVVDDSPPPNT